MDNKQQMFFEFLRENRATENYMRAYEQQNAVEWWVEALTVDSQDWISTLFLWFYTEEGQYYWNDLNQKWREISNA